MSRTESRIYNKQLAKSVISNLNMKLSKKGKSLFLTLYNHQTLQHKNLAEALDMPTNSLSNLISKINDIEEGLIEFETIGRRKFYTLSQVAEEYTEIVLIPDEIEKEHARTSILYTDSLTQNVLDFLRKFQQSAGDDWYIDLDDLLFLEVHNRPVTDTNLKEETYQNYTNFKKALISLIIQDGSQAAKKIYSILDHKILSKRMDSLVTNLLDDFYQLEPLFHLEKVDLQAAYSVIDRIFSECWPEIFETNSNYINQNLPANEYDSVYRAISKMIREFKNYNYNKIISIEMWGKKFYTGNRYSCISYIAEKCSTVYIGREKLPSL